MKTVWSGRVVEASAKYGEHAPMAAVCCNACRTCVTTNVLGIVTGGAVGAVYAIGQLARRVFRRP